MDIDILSREVSYKATTSSGAGGQHVNKVATRVQLFFDVYGSHAFAKAEKEQIINRLQSKLTSAGMLVLSCQSSRSQLANKKQVFQDLLILLEEVRKVPKVRRKSAMPARVKRKRMESKRRQSEKKKERGFRY